MGHLIFGAPGESVTIDDRVLAHLKLVMLTKLRRHEGFPFSFEYDVSAGSGRSTVWLSASQFIEFRFDGSRPCSINKSWLELLMATANEGDGLRVVAEPEEIEFAGHGKTIPLNR